MLTTASLTRRDFLKTTGSLVVSFPLCRLTMLAVPARRR